MRRAHYIRDLLIIGVWVTCVAPAQLAPNEGKAVTLAVGFFAWQRDTLVTDLKPVDLTILDNKQPVQSISSLKKGSDLPLRLGFLVDASKSQRTNPLYEPALKAATKFLNNILEGPDDRLFFGKVDTQADISSFMNATELGSY
jgi:hypothetical protein